MILEKLIEKGKRKILKKRSKFLYKTGAHSFLYFSYWHSLFVPPSKSVICKQYLTSVPNKGAGIGHQMANWIAGLWFSNKFGLEFAHSEFSKNWESVLGIGQNLRKVQDLKSAGYKVVRLPLFNENDPYQVAKVRGIIDSYKGKKIIFLTDLDQFYADQFGVMEELQDLFFNSPARANDIVEYEKGSINIACHIRRGDIVQSLKGKNSNLSMRYQSENYFIKVLDQVVEILSSVDNVHVYVFSQGDESEFVEFKKYKNVHYRINADQYSSFLHMVYADLLITSKSSFSYKPALISKGIKICPKDFWHGYPDKEDFILVDNDGNFIKNSANKINELMNSKMKFLHDL